MHRPAVEICASLDETTATWRLSGPRPSQLTTWDRAASTFGSPSDRAAGYRRHGTCQNGCRHYGRMAAALPLRYLPVCSREIGL
jgi:hypothetical protein